MKFRLYHQRGDALMIALITLLFVAFLGTVFVKNYKNIRIQAAIDKNAKNLSVIEDGLTLYMKQNENSITKGYRIAGVADANNPTFEELIKLNYLPSNVITKVRLSPLTMNVKMDVMGKIGLIYTTSPITNDQGKIDVEYACQVAFEASERGLCSRMQARSGWSTEVVGRNRHALISISGLQYGALAIQIQY